jgi:hypothetical protein
MERQRYMKRSCRTGDQGRKNFGSKFSNGYSLEVQIWTVRPSPSPDRTRLTRSTVPDGDGSTPRSTAARFPAFLALVEESDIICQMDGGCAFCRRGGVTGKGKGRVVPTREEGEVRASLRCSRCPGVSYCSVGCQRMAWSFHKPRCKPVGK